MSPLLTGQPSAHTRLTAPLARERDLLVATLMHMSPVLHLLMLPRAPLQPSPLALPVGCLVQPLTVATLAIRPPPQTGRTVALTPLTQMLPSLVTALAAYLRQPLPQLLRPAVGLLLQEAKNHIRPLQLRKLSRVPQRCN